MKLDNNSTTNQGILLDYLYGRRSLRETLRVLNEFGDYINENEDSQEVVK